MVVADMFVLENTSFVREKALFVGENVSFVVENALFDVGNVFTAVFVVADTAASSSIVVSDATVFEGFVAIDGGINCETE